MKVSVVLPNLNGAGWLRGCVDSLLAQTGPDLEIIIVDNASTDESLAAAREYAALPDGKVTLVENSVNTGFSAAVNTGIALAAAPYVLLFNNDAFARPDMVAKLLAAMEAEPRLFAAQCLMLQHRAPERVDDAGDFLTLPGWAFQRGNGRPASRYQRPLRVFSACGGAALYRKAALDEIGPFDERFFAYLEDVDMGWRANARGWKSRLCPAAVCTHMGGAASSGAAGAKYNPFKSVQSGRNSLLLPLKNLPLFFLLLDLPFLLPGYLVKTLVFHLRGYGGPWRQGMREALRLLPKMKKPRFRWRDLPHHLWVQLSLFTGCFRFVAWRLARLFAG